MDVRKDAPLRVVSWNVNGIRAACRKGFRDWLGTCGGHIVGVQEVRARREQVPKELCSHCEGDGWHMEITPAERPGYSGVGLFARRPPDEVTASLERKRFDVEGRVQLARFGDLRVVNTYFPNGNGKDRDLSRIPYKLSFYRRLFAVLKDDFAAGVPILVLGDFNTAHREIDLARPKQNVETSGFRPEERRELERWLKKGWVDTYRHFHPESEGAYTWWSQRFGVREKNIGWRIDMILASPGAVPHLRGAAIHPEVMGSDHCPISVDLDPAVLGPDFTPDAAAGAAAGEG